MSLKKSAIYRSHPWLNSTSSENNPESRKHLSPWDSILLRIQAHASAAWYKQPRKRENGNLLYENVFLLGRRSMISSTAVGMMSLMMHKMLHHVSSIKPVADLFIDHY